MSNLVRAKRLPKTAAAEQSPPKQSDIARVTRLMGRFMAGHRRQFVLAGLMLVIETLAAVLIPLLIAYVITYLSLRLSQLGGKAVLPPPTPLTYLGLPTLIDPDIDTVAFVTIGIVVLEMINSAADSLAEIFLAKGGRLMGLNLRVGLYSHLQRLSLAFYNQQRTGDLLTRVTSDVTALEDFVTTSLSDIVGSVLLITFILITMIIYDWRVAIVALVSVPIMALISNYFSQRIKAASKKQRSREGELASAAQEMLTSIRVIQTYGRGGEQEKRFAAQSRKTMDSALEAAGLQARFSWVVSVLESVATAAIIWLGVWLVFGSIGTPNALGIGVLTAFIKYIQDMFKPTKKIIKEWNTFGKIFASVERIGELFDRKPAVQDEPGAVEAPPLKGEIEYRHVSFAYQLDQADRSVADGEQPQLRLALNEVDFHIAPSEVVALVGGSGAGKSTIVQLLPRLYDPHSGQILIDGHDIREFTLDSLRAQMSMVLQESVLFTGTVAENIAYGLTNATREQVIAAAIQANAHEFIEKLPDGYDSVLGERAGTLSGGQRQRIAIARAFIRNTPILILDEPTTGLDAESTELVLLALRSLMRGKATLIISHDLNLIRHADRIVVIKAGQIEQVGTHKSLLKAGGLYADLYHKQFGQAMEEQDGQGKPKPALVADADEEAEPVTPKVFQTLMTQALPKPISSQAFQTLMTQALPAIQRVPAPGHAATPAAQAPAPSHAATPAAQAPAPAVAHAMAQATAEPAVRPAASAAVRTDRDPPQPPAAGPARPAQPRSKAFETTLMRTVTTPPSADAGPPANVAPAEGQTTFVPALTRLPADQSDPLSSPILLRDLPGLKTALDGDAMREYLQSVLFGKARANYRIERCTPGKAIYMGDYCALRYQLEVADSAGGPRIRPLVSGRVFQSQLACALYMRDRLSPLAALVHDRAEVQPFAAPVALIEPLNMVVHVFPLDGDLPSLIGATDRPRMVELFGETLPDALDEQFTPQDCQIVPVNYARRQRCVLRYEITGLTAGNRPARRDVYGKVGNDNQGALIAPVISALQKHMAANGRAHQFSIPRSLGFRPDLHLALLEAIPGTPLINQLIKARTDSAPAAPGALTLEAAIDACAHVASTLHTSGIALGTRRTLDDDLAAVQRDIHMVARIVPNLGTQFQSWLDRIATYAEESDALRPGFSHGDYTYTQLIFDGTECGLVDFDTICQAEPALDLGQFLAYLRVATRKAHKRAAAPASDPGAQLGERFLQTYIASTGDRLEDADRLRIRVSVYLIVSLLRMALHSWQQLKIARMENVISVLEEEMVCLPQLDY